MNPAACDCTDGPTSTVCTYYPVLDCNDFNETARKVSDIRATGVKTIVIGYGDVFGTSAQRSLQQIALAGDFQRRCAAGGGECNPNDTACFLDSNPNLCAEQFFRATSKEQLSRGAGGGELGDPPGQPLPGGARAGAGRSDVPHRRW